MKRIPSLHITSNDLSKVLDRVIRVLELDIDIPTSILVKHIMSEGKTHSLSNRNLLVDTKKIAKKVTQLAISPLEDALLFSKYLQLIRKKYYHVGINIIKEGNKEWATLKEVTKLAITFAEDFDLTKEKAFEYYISIGIEKMGKFHLARFNSIHQQICEHYQAKVEIEKSGWTDLAQEAYDIYQQRIIDRTGGSVDHKAFPDKLLAFLNVAKLCKNKGIDVKVYIDAQFEGLDWAGGIPEPHSLLGTKANERLFKYLYKNKINLKESTENKPKIDWKKIKHGKSTD